MSKKIIKPKILTFAQMCAKVAPSFVTKTQCISITELVDGHKNENNYTHAPKAGVLKFNDTAGDTHTVTWAPASKNYLGDFKAAVNNATDTVTWTFKVADSKLDFLRVGQTLTQTYKITLTDYAGNKTYATVTVKLVGTNDRPVICADTQGSVTEDTNVSPTNTLKDSGFLKFDDVDLADKHEVRADYNGDAKWSSKLSSNQPIDPAIISALSKGFKTDVTGAKKNGTWTYEIANKLVQFLDKGEKITLSFTVTVKDNSGTSNSTDTEKITITIYGTEDAPVAVADTNWVKEDGPKSIAAGNVLKTQSHSDAPFGTFGDKADTDVDATDTLTVTNPGTIKGMYGTLVLKSDGTYTYTLNSANSKVQGLSDTETLNDVFTYTITDGASNVSSTLTITIFGTDDPVEITNLTPAISGGDVTVDEDDLPTGSDSVKESLTQTGTFTVSAPDGIAELKIDTGGGLAGIIKIVGGGTTSAFPISVTTPLGNTLTVTGFDATTGVVTYTYTLTGAEKHDDGNGENELFESFTVTLTDEDPVLPDTATAQLVVRIIDDVPSASYVVSSDANVVLTTQDADTKGASSDTDSTTTGFASLFNLTSSYGADGAGSTVVSYALSVKGAVSGLSSDTAPIFLYDIGGVVVGSTATTVGAVNATNTIFEISVNSSTGAVTLTQHAEIDHALPGSATAPYDTQFAYLGDNLVSLTATAKVTDADNDTASTSASIDLGGNIRFADDGPAAVADVDTITAATTQILTFDNFVTLPEGDETPLSGVYGGFTWTQTGIHNPQPGSPYVTATGDYLAFFAEALPPEHPGYPGQPQGSPISVTGGIFSFLGANFVSRNDNPLTVTVTGYPADGGAPVVHSISVPAGEAPFFDFSSIAGFTNLSKIEFHATNYFGFDNFTTRGVSPAATGNVVTGSDLDNVPNHDSNGTDGAADDLGADGFGSIAWTGGPPAGTAGTVAGTYGTLSVDADGNYSYALNSNHPDVVALNGTQSLPETFTYTITDGDGDTSQATLTITVRGANDPVVLSHLDVPGGELVLDEDDLPDGTSPNPGALQQTGTFTIVAPDGVASLTIGGTIVPLDGTSVAIGGLGTPLGNALSVRFNAATGVVTYTYTLLDNEAHPTAGGENSLMESFAVVVIDSDGTTANASLDITIVDDVPSIAANGITPPTLTVDESNLANNAVGDFSLNFTSAFGADGPGSLTYALSVVANGPTGLTDVATGHAVVLVNNNGVVEGRTTGSNHLVFTISVDSAGVVTLDQIRALTHPDKTDPNDPVTLATGLVSLVATITDGDNDTASASRDIGGSMRFLDDGPSIVAANALPTLTVDESNLGSNAFGDFSLNFTSAFGADGPGSLTYALSVLANGPTGLTDVATGHAVVLVNNNGVVEGRTTGSNHLVFTISVDSAGVVTLDQIRALTHPDKTDPNDPVTLATGLVSLVATITDGDDDTASASRDIGGSMTFLDDGPTAKSDTALTVADTAGPTSGVNLLANDVLGADGATLTHLNFDGTWRALSTLSPSFTVSGIGVFTASANGDWTFDPVDRASDTSFTFGYRITDGDGDVSEATQVVSITNANSLPSAGTAGATVDDEGLAGGIKGDGNSTGDVDGEATTATGALPHNFGGDGQATTDPISFAGMAGPGVVGTENVTYTWNSATNTLTATSARGAIFTVQVDGGADALAQGNYVFTLLKPILHPVGGGENDATIALAYTVRDSNGDTAPGTLTITVDDDTPVAEDTTAIAVAGVKPTVNAIFVIDLSLSMGTANPNPAPGFATRLELLKAAVQNLLSNTDVDFQDITIVTFGTAAATTFRLRTTDVSAAISEINSYTQSSLSGGTDYNAAVLAVMNYFNQPLTPDLSDAMQTNLYFLTDGDPQSGGNVSNPAAWQSFLTNTLDVDHVYSVGFSGLSNPAFLQQITRSGNGDDVAKFVTNPAELSATLAGSLPGNPSGNIFEDIDGNIVGGFGADDGHVKEITYHGVTYVYGTADPAHGYNGGATVEIDDGFGGKLIFNFIDNGLKEAGDWDYYAPDSGLQSAQSLDFDYVLVDGDGDLESGSLTIDLKLPPTLSVGSATATEGDGFIQFAVSLSHATLLAVPISFSTANGSATGGGVDFGAAIQWSLNGVDNWQSGPFSFAAGQTQVFVRVPVVDDSINEPSETFTLTATATSGGVSNITGTATNTGTIHDNGDLPPAISISDVTVNEGVTATFTITLSAPSGSTVTVNYATANGTAQAGSDYTAASGTVSFAPGETTKTVTVLTTNDTTVEASETFVVNLTSPTNATIADSQGVAVINDNDTNVFTVADVSVTEGNSSTKVMTFTVTRSGTSDVPIEFTWSTANGTATAGSDYIGSAGGVISFPAGTGGTQTFSVTINGDTTAELDETFTVTLVPATGSASRVSNASDLTAVGTITNDDAPPNTAPTAASDTIFVSDSTSVVIPWSALLANDSDLDGDTLTISSVTNLINVTGGTISVANNVASQTVTFTTGNLTSNDTTGNTFTYTVSDGKGGTSVGTVNVQVYNIANSGGETFTFPSGSYHYAHIFTSGGDDIITVPNGQFTAPAVIDGGTGTGDTLNVGASFTSASDAQLVNIENVVVTASGGTLDLSNQTEGFNITAHTDGGTVTAGTGADTVVVNATVSVGATWTVNLGSDAARDKVVFNHTSLGDTHNTVATVNGFVATGPNSDRIAVTLNSTNIADGGFQTFSTTGGSADDVGNGIEVLEITSFTTSSLTGDSNGGTVETAIANAIDNINSGNYTVIVYSGTGANADAGIYSMNVPTTISGGNDLGTGNFSLEHIMTLTNVGFGNLSSANFASSTDPLVLDLDGNGFAFSSVADGAAFDIDADGHIDQVAWNTSGDGMLAIDLNGNGIVDDGSELFTPFFNGGGFKTGAEALASLDDNRDGVIDAGDAAFAKLLVWQDLNRDGLSGAGELASLTDLGITSLSAGTVPAFGDIDGQAVIGEGTFTRADGSVGTYVEVELDTVLGGSSAAHQPDYII